MVARIAVASECSAGWRRQLKCFDGTRSGNRHGGAAQQAYERSPRVTIGEPTRSANRHSIDGRRLLPLVHAATSAAPTVASSIVST
jgi:hypothetical protein